MKVHKSEISLDNIKSSKRTRKRVDYCDKIENEKKEKISKKELDEDDSDFEPPKSKLNSSHHEHINKNRNLNGNNVQKRKPQLSENDEDENIPLKILSKKLKNCSKKSNCHVSRPNLSEDESSDSDNEEITFRLVPDNLLKEPFGETCCNDHEVASFPQKVNVDELNSPNETIKTSKENATTDKNKEFISESKTLSKRKSDSKLDTPQKKRQKTAEKKNKHGNEKSKKKSKKSQSKDQPMKMSELLKNENLNVGFSSDEASGSDWEDVNGINFFHLFTKNKSKL